MFDIFAAKRLCTKSSTISVLKLSSSANGAKCYSLGQRPRRQPKRNPDSAESAKYSCTRRITLFLRPRLRAFSTW